MKSRILGIVVLSVLALGALFAWSVQRSQLTGLRQETRAAREALSAVAGGPTPAVTEVADSPSPSPSPSPLTPEEKLELMELRNKVSTLRERQRALAGASNENAQLQTQQANLESYAGDRRPPGYISRKEAKNVGAATPEAAMQSLLWSLEHRDTNCLFSLLEPGSAQRMSAHFSSEGAEEFFKKLDVLPGGRVLSRAQKGADHVELQVELLAGRTVPMQLRLIDGTWRFEGF